MDLAFSAVYRGDVPLVQHCPIHGNFDLFFTKFSEKNEIPLGKTVMLVEKCLWGILLEENGLTFITVITDYQNQVLIDRILNEVKVRFLRNHASTWKKAGPFSLQTSFEPQLIQIRQTLRKMHGCIRSSKDLSDDVGYDNMKNNIDDKLFSPLVMSEEAGLRDGELVYSKIPMIMKEGSVCADILPWGVAITVAVLLIYLILVFSCGGPTLRPGCR